MSDLPDLLAHKDAALALLRRRPACVFTDIDGTLSPIVADPLAATVPGATRTALEALAERIAVVALTGRSVADARRVLGLDTVVYSGNHGAEWWENGVVSIEPAAEPYFERVREIAQAVENEASRRRASSWRTRARASPCTTGTRRSRTPHALPSWTSFRRPLPE